MNPLAYTEHDCTTDHLPVEAMRGDLRAHGVCVVRVFDDARAAEIEARTVRVRDRLRVDGGTAHGALSMGGITKTYGAACSPEVALIRVDARIRAVHAAVYGLAPGDVFSGWDAIGTTGTDAVRRRGASAPATARAEYEALTGSKLQAHVDVGIQSHGGRMERRMAHLHPDMPCCVQSQYVVSSVPRGGATLVVAPGAYADRPPDPLHFDMSSGRDFCVCTDAGHEALRSQWRAVEAPRGCLILWLSRTPHGNKLADPGVDARRFVVYVAWQARALVTEEERADLRERKRNAVLTGGTTDHWATQVPRVYRGSHYSNGQKRTRVLYNAENPPPLPPDLLERIEECF